MKIVLDTNVIIAGIISEGLCHRILAHSLEADIVTVSPFILDEVQSVLQNKFNFPVSFIEETLTFLSQIESVIPENLPESVCRDRNDDNILALAIHINANVIISGDLDLLDIGSYQGIQIIKPNKFWEFLP